MNPLVRRFAFALAATGALIALVAMAAIYGAVLWRIATSTHGASGDYIAFYAAGWLVRGDGAASLYDATMIETAERLLYPGVLRHPLAFLNPVFVAWLFAPLSMLPYTGSYFAWLAINAALLIAVLHTTERHILRDAPDGLRRLFIGAAALSMPVLATLVFGQLDLIALAGLLGGYLLLRAERPWPAGLALCAVLVKPHFLIGAGLLLLFRREWRAVAALAIVGVPLLVLPPLLTAPGTLVDNAAALAGVAGSSDDLPGRASVMANWRGFVTSLTNSSNALYWLPGLAAIAIGALALALPRWREATPGPAFDRAYSLAVLFPLVVSPHLHTQSLSLLLLPAALMLRAQLDAGAALDRTAAIVLAGYAALFFLPFFAIQGLSLTFFLTATLFVVAARAWPAGEPATVRAAETAARVPAPASKAA